MIAHSARAARNIANGLVATRALAEERVAGAEVRKVEREKLTAEITSVMRDAEAELIGELDKFSDYLKTRLDSSRKTFLQRATASLVKHLEQNGESKVWTYDPTGLRVLLRSGYQVFSAKATRATSAVYQKTATALEGLFMGAFELPGGAFRLEPPPVPDTPPPVTLGQTIALDIKGNWWTRWWRRRRSYAAFAEEFSGMIDAEIAPLIEALKKDHADVFRDTATKELRRFVAGQRTTLLAMAGQAEERLEELRARMAHDAETKANALSEAQDLLSGLGVSEQQKERVHDDV
jgi:hypothetical protein